MTEKKKKLIRITGLPNSRPSGVYSFNGMHFAFVSSPENGDRKQVTSMMTCREYVNSTVRASVKGQGCSHYKPANGKVDMDKLRLLIVHDGEGEFKRRLFNGKAGLNIVEQMAGWERSTITTVVHSAYKNAWLLTGPKEWMSQPQLLSLGTWLIRLATFKLKLDVTSYDALEACLANARDNIPDANSDASSYLKQFWNRMYVLTKYNTEIFGADKKMDGWNATDNGFGVLSGFLSFCTNEATYSSFVRKAHKNFAGLCRKHLPRKNPLIKKSK
jgi:hypothetical protein